MGIFKLLFYFNVFTYITIGSLFYFGDNLFLNIIKITDIKNQTVYTETASKALEKKDKLDENISRECNKVYTLQRKAEDIVKINLDQLTANSEYSHYFRSINKAFIENIPNTLSYLNHKIDIENDFIQANLNSCIDQYGSTQNVISYLNQ